MIDKIASEFFLLPLTHGAQSFKGLNLVDVSRLHALGDFNSDQVVILSYSHKKDYSFGEFCCYQVVNHFYSHKNDYALGDFISDQVVINSYSHKNDFICWEISYPTK